MLNRACLRCQFNALAHCNHGAPSKGRRNYRLRRSQNGGARRGIIAMANILVNIEKGIQIGAADALKWLTGAEKSFHAAPTVVAALATLLGAVEKPLVDIAGVAANPLNIPLDIQTVTDLKTAWPELVAFMTSLGVKF